MKPLQQRKRELLLASELSRQTLRLEWSRIELQAERWRRQLHMLRMGWMLAPAALLLLRRPSRERPDPKPRRGKLARLTAGLGWMRRIFNWLRALSS